MAVLLALWAAAPLWRATPSDKTADTGARGDTITVDLTADQFAGEPTWRDVVAYYGLEEKLVEPTRLANAGPDGVCPPEHVKLPQTVVIALSPGSDRVCRARP